MFASSVIHFAYYITLAHAYRTGDLSFAYPLMRGIAPLLVALLGAIVLGELPTLHVAVGIVLICAGIVSIAFIRREKHPPGAARWALTNAAIIGCYTLIDGAGVRASGNAMGYVAWLLFLEGLPFLLWIYARNGARAVAYVRTSWPRHFLGGAFSVLRLRHRAMGHDPGTRGGGSCIARDFGAVRCAVRLHLAQGRLRPDAARRRGECRGRRGGVEVVKPLRS